MATIEELETRLTELEARIGPMPQAVAPVTIGELADVPTPGAPIASQWTQEVTRRAVHRFATVAARDAAYAAAAAGTGAMCVTTDTGIVWTVAAGIWLPAGFGEIAYADQPTTIGPAGPAIFDIGGLTVTFIAIAGARYEITGNVAISTNNAANTTVTLTLADAANTVINSRRFTLLAGSYGHFVVTRRVTPAAGTITYKLRAEAAAGTVNVNDVGQAGVLIVKRIA